VLVFENLLNDDFFQQQDILLPLILQGDIDVHEFVIRLSFLLLVGFRIELLNL
jgi:hypothetical protein